MHVLTHTMILIKLENELAFKGRHCFLGTTTGMAGKPSKYAMPCKLTQATLVTFWVASSPASFSLDDLAHALRNVINIAGVQSG